MKQHPTHITSPRIYLDYAAATPLRSEVQALMMTHLADTFGNPSAIHQAGQQAKAALEAARQQVATTAGIRPAGVVFTASGTESNNLAILGVIEELHQAGRPYTEMEVVSTAIEHPSVLETLAALKEKGVTVRYAPLTETGRVDVLQLESVLTEKTVLCTVAYANSEIGVIQPLRAISRKLRVYTKVTSQPILLHTDAAQAPLWLPCQLEALGVDMMSLDAGKCYGPKGVGMLLLRGKVSLTAVLYGGSQESGRRPATENVPSIAGAALAFSLAQAEHKDSAERVAKLRDDALTVLETLSQVVINGDTEHRIANNINISIPGYDSEFAVVSLDAAGVACSTRSACAGADGGGSTVVRAVYGDESRARSTIRFTLGVDTTTADLAELPALLTDFITRQAPYQKPTSRI